MTNSAVTDVQWSGNYSSGRPYGDPTTIVIHHWGSDGQSHQGVVDYLCRSGGDTSAHYVASAGRVTQLVHDYDRAWHAGSAGNPFGIGIECRPEMSDGDVATVQGLIAAIRAEHGNLAVTGHRDYMSTACPGRWYNILAQLDAGTAAGAPGGSTSPSEVSNGVVAGTAYPSWPSTWDGTDPWVISTGEGWLTENGEWNLPTALRHCRVMNAEGYHEIFAHANLQRFLNSAIPAESLRSLNGYDALEVDGIWGSDTTRALQYLMWCWVPEVVRVRAANRSWGQFVTGVWDIATAQVYQRMLNMSVSHSAKLMGS